MGNYEDALDRIEEKITDLDYLFVKTETYAEIQRAMKDLRNTIYQLNRKIEALEESSKT